MQSLEEKNQPLSSRAKSCKRFYLAIYFAIQPLLLYQIGQYVNQVDCSLSQHHNLHRQTRARQELVGDVRDFKRRSERDYHHVRRRRLHSRAAYPTYDHSRINSSESLSSSWFYQQDQPAILDQCCACDEAKYELVFEGLWSKYTHPDDFPENYWLAYFSDIIGASHSNDFRMWSQDSLASDGVRELAETGATKKLESELKQVSSKTRTIIKARELRYPMLNSKTSAVFRTDKHHHLVSILSKLGPSPDWMVGVSGLELCQVDCTWAAQRVINLYLWDAGTDSGSTFVSSDMPTRPQERIHPYQRADNGGRVTQVGASSSSGSSNGAGDSSLYFGQQRNQKSSAQAGPEQLMMLPPLIDDSSATTTTMLHQEQMKPFARLTITRQRIYEKSCNANISESIPVYNRPNSYNPLAEPQQPHHLKNGQSTTNLYPVIQPNAPSYSDCRFTDWSDWSSCSSTCGKGIRTRTRSFYDDQAHLTAGCLQSDLIEKEICLADCIGNASCVTHDWSEWSKCSVSCGQGFRKRTRSPIGPYKAACASIELAEMEQCTGSCEQDADTQAPPSHCGVTEWSQWSECSVACGKGTKIRTRQFVRREDIDSCGNIKLLQKQSCNGRPELCQKVASKSTPQNGQSTSLNHHQRPNQKQFNSDLPVIDCKLSNWSPWSTCSALCGFGKRTRSRYIIQMPQNGGKPCDKKLSRTQRCKDLPPCPPDFSINSSGHSSRNAKANGQHLTASTSSPLSSHFRTTTSTTTQGSMMDDEDDSKFSRLLKAELGHLKLASYSLPESYISDSVATSTEMELIGSSSFQIRNGFVYPFGDGETKERRITVEGFFK